MIIGTFTYAKNVDKYMPEDVIHCGFLFSLAKTLHCNILDIPGRVVPSDYEIISMTHYSVWNCIDKHYGTLFVDHQVRLVTVMVHTTDTILQWTYDEWANKLREKDFIILPMIFRSGACVKQADGVLGLVVPWPSTQRNYSEDGGKYRYITNMDGSVQEMQSLALLQHLIPVGTELYLDVQSVSGCLLRSKIPRNQEHLRYIVVRLNTPSVIHPMVDKVYVTYLQRPSKANASVSTFTSATITVDVWELVTAITEDFIPALMM